jgi:hypothetical protein
MKMRMYNVKTVETQATSNEFGPTREQWKVETKEKKEE